MEYINTPVDINLKTKIRRIAGSLNLSMAEFIRDAIEHYFKHLDNQEEQS